MTLDIALVLLLLVAALVLFITEWLRMDVVALLMLCALALLGLVLLIFVQSVSPPGMITPAIRQLA